MSIHWGSLSGRMKVGVEVIAPRLTGTTTSATFTVNYYVDNTSYAMSDDQVLGFSGGTISGSHNFKNVWDDGAHKITSRTFTHAITLGGGQKVTLGAKITGVFNGWSPSVSYTYTVPKRPASLPGKPPTPSVFPRPGQESERLQIDWHDPSNTGGVPLTGARIQISAHSNMGSPIDDYNDSTPPAYGHTTLQPGTTYYVRTRARNSVGEGPWSNVASATTAAVPPSAPSGIALTPADVGQVHVSWHAATAHGSPVTGYTVEVTTPSGTSTLSASSASVLATVTPGDAVSVRVKAHSAVGDSPWSGTVSTTAPLQWWWGTTTGPVAIKAVFINHGGQVRPVRLWTPDPTTGQPVG